MPAASCKQVDAVAVSHETDISRILAAGIMGGGGSQRSATSVAVNRSRRGYAGGCAAGPPLVAWWHVVHPLPTSSSALHQHPGCYLASEGGKRTGGLTAACLLASLYQWWCCPLLLHLDLLLLLLLLGSMLLLLLRWRLRWLRLLRPTTARSPRNAPHIMLNSGCCSVPAPMRPITASQGKRVRGRAGRVGGTPSYLVACSSSSSSRAASVQQLLVACHQSAPHPPTTAKTPNPPTPLSSYAEPRWGSCACVIRLTGSWCWRRWRSAWCSRCCGALVGHHVARCC